MSSAPPQPPPTLYVDLMSQPSRVCAIVCDLAGLTTAGGNGRTAIIAVATLRLDRGEQRSEEYARLNPLKKVPFLALPASQGIPESGAIIPYLAATYPDRVPPGFRRPSRCALAAARHDAALLWLQSALRVGATRLVFNRVVGKLVFKQPVSREVAAHGASVLKAAIADLEQTWLSGGRRRFIGGGGDGDDDAAAAAAAAAPLSRDTLGAADVLCLCELDQLLLLDAADPDGGPCARDFIAPGSIVEAWRDRVREACGGERGAYGRATRTLRAAAARFARERGGGASKL